jgi:hypothetical protein
MASQNKTIVVRAPAAWDATGLRSVILDYVRTRMRLAFAKLLVRGAARVHAAAAALAVVSVFVAR